MYKRPDYYSDEARKAGSDALRWAYPMSGFGLATVLVFAIFRPVRGTLSHTWPALIAVIILALTAFVFAGMYVHASMRATRMLADDRRAYKYKKKHTGRPHSQ